MFGHATCFVPISASAITSSHLVAAMVVRVPPMFSPQPSPISPQSSYPPLINIGCGEELSIRELAEMIADIVGYSSKLVFDSSKPDGTMRKLMEVSRMKSMGWVASTNLRKGIYATYQSYLKDAK